MEKSDKKNYMTLSQALKKYDFIDTGGMAKMFLAENEVYVDDVLENRRGRKIYGGETLSANGKKVIVENDRN